MTKRRDDEPIQEIGSFFSQGADEYDIEHCDRIDGGAECYRRVADYVPTSTKTLLDLGCGTGLELEEIYRRLPNLVMRGVDLAEGMVKKLYEKFPDKDVSVQMGSYFDYDFTPESFDTVMSVMTLHHFSPEEKLGLYKRIHSAVKNGGVYVECDYMAKSDEEEAFYFAEHKRLREENSDIEGIIHYDTPMTPAHQLEILKKAGFSKVEKVWGIESTVIIVAHK